MTSENAIPPNLKTVAGWSWRLLAIGLAIAVVLFLVVQLRVIVIPLLVAILLSALLTPLVNVIVRLGAPKWLGIVAALLTLISAVTVLVWLIVSQLRSVSTSFAERALTVYDEILDWLAQSPLHIDQNQIDAWVDSVVAAFQKDLSSIWTGALEVGITVGHVAAGVLLTTFSLIFMLIDGPRIWRWVVRLAPTSGRAAVDGAGRAGWVSVGNYVRIQIFVAFVDAVGIAIGAAILGVPLVIPIAVMVFLGSFVPFLGMILAGTVATFIALVYNGPVNALIMLAVVILVNQIEAHILQPLVMGTAVRLHPLAVVLSVSSGALIAGIPGALFAVPLVASISSMARYLSKRGYLNKPDPLTIPQAQWLEQARVEARAEIDEEMRREPRKSRRKLRDDQAQSATKASGE